MLRRLAAVAAFAVACNSAPPAPPVVARSADGALVVTAPDVSTELERVRSESSAEANVDPASLESLRRAVLDAIVERRLLVAKARQLSLSVTPAELEDAVSARTRTISDVPEGTHIPPRDELRARTEEQLLVERLLIREVAARVALGLDDAKAYYDAHKDEFRREEEVRILQVLVATRPEAEALQREITRGVDFRRLAREQSIAPDAEQGGDLGWSPRSGLPPELADVAFALKKGQVSDVVQSPFGFHLLKLVERREPTVRPFTDVERALERRLRREAVAKAQVAYVDGLRAEAKITVDEIVLGKVQ